MISTPNTIACRLLISATPGCSPSKWGRVVEENRQQHHETGAEKGAENTPEAADDDHEQDLEGALDVERQRLDARGVDERPERARDADVERADAESEQLGAQRTDADDLGREVHVADRHPHSADPAAHHVLGGERQQRDHRQGEQVLAGGLGLRPGDEQPPEQGTRRGADHPRGGVVLEPRELGEHPDQEELRGERRHRQVEAFDPEARDAEQDADQGGDQPGQDEHRDDVQPGKGGGELVGRERADRHESPGSERNLPGIAGQNIEPDRRQRVDEKRNQDRVEPVFAGEQRNNHGGQHQQRRHADPILAQRPQRLIGGVARLELTGFAIQHGYTRSMMRSPNRPCGRTSRKTSASR